jgi:hypothetical protein
LAAGEHTLFARSSATSWTTESQYLFWVEVLLHGGRCNRAPVSLRSNDGHVSHRYIRQSLGTRLKMQPKLTWLPNGFEKTEDDRNQRDVHPYRTRCASAGTIRSPLPPRLLSHRTKAPPTHLKSRGARVLNKTPPEWVTISLRCYRHRGNSSCVPRDGRARWGESDTSKIPCRAQCTLAEIILRSSRIVV